MGYVNEGTPGNPNFDESFVGDNVNYNTNGCAVYTETFSARYKLTRTFAAGNYQFTVGADDGYRLSLDGGTTWVINNWNDQSYTITSYTTSLNGTYNLVIEYYENGGGNRISFNVQTACLGSEDQSIYGTGNIWNGYIYDRTNFNQYNGMVNEGSAAGPNFDENFGGDNVIYATSACGVQTETFSARYRLQKTMPNGNYIFTVGGDDGYRLSLDGGSTWVINQWNDQSYMSATYSTELNGTYNIVLEYFENGGQNRISFNMTSTVLPVQLVSFEGKSTGKKTNLNWTVTKEVNTSYYEIQRSADGSNFIALGKVDAAKTTSGNSAEKKYTFIDPAPLTGSNYYRLRMVDLDNTNSWSPVIRVFFDNKNTVSIFPELLSTGESIHISTAVALSNVLVECYDITGKNYRR